MQRSTIFSAFALAFALSSAAAAQDAAGNNVSLDQGVISGLGIRNIGSAQMSGRISALAAGRKKDGDLALYVGAASGGGPRTMRPDSRM